MGSESWQFVPFDRAVEVNPNVPLVRKGVFPFVNMQSVQPFTRNVEATELREYTGGGARFQVGDTLMARITPSLENGKISRFIDGDPLTIGHGSTEFIIIRGREGISDNAYAYYLTVWDEVRQYAISQMTGSSGRQRVPTDSLSNITIPLPPLPEQRAIAAVLGALDDKIELNRRMNETLEATARALFKSWFVDFDPVRAKMEGRPSGLPQEIEALFPGEMEDGRPLGWGVRQLGEIIELAYGKALKETNRRLGDIPVFGSNGQVGWHDEKLVQGPGIIVGRKGNPGIVTWSHTDFFCIDTTFYVVSKLEPPALHFLHYALQHHELASLSADSAVPGLNRNMAYGNIQVLPIYSVLTLFEETISDLYKRIHTSETESRTLAALRDTLLPKLMSGEVRVSLAEQEAADAL